MDETEFTDGTSDDPPQIKGAGVDEFEHEVDLARQNEELMDFLEERSKSDRTFSLDQVRDALGLTGKFGSP
jgi:hypothetical protein